LEALEDVVSKVGWASGAALLVSLGLLVARWRMGTVRARRFVLRGDGGQPIAQLVQGPNGGELELRDDNGEITAVLSRGLKLCDRAGQVRADLRLESDKAPLLELYDERGGVRASLSVGEDGAGREPGFGPAGEASVQIRYQFRPHPLDRSCDGPALRRVAMGFSQLTVVVAPVPAGHCLSFLP